MGGCNLSGGLMPPAANHAEEEKERWHSRDSGNASQEEESEVSGDESQEEVSVDNSDTEDTPSNGANTLTFQLTQSLLSQVKASENNRNANSGKQAYKDLPRMDFVINGQVIDKNFVSQLRDKCNQNDQRQIAKHVFTKMFEHAKAEIPNDNLLEELINSCNQAGHDGSLLMQLSPIFLGHDLQLPDANDRHIEIVCSDQDSLNIKYCPNMPVKQLGKEICRVDAILEFTLKSQDGKVEYEDGKVTLTIPEQLKNYKVDGKSLLDDIKMHFEDVDNAIIESLLENIDEGQNSFVVDLPTEVNSDSFDIIPEDTVFDLGHIPELVKKAVDDKDVNALANHIGFFQDHVTHVSSKEGLPVVEKTLEIVSGFTKEQSKPWRCYPTVPIASHIYSVKQQYCDGYISQEGYEKLKKMEETLCKIKSDLIKRSSNDPNEESPVKNAQDTSAILNETPTSSQAVNQEDNNQLSTKESKSTDNQQLQSGIVDEGENIMDNEKASEEAIGNNYRRGKMPKNIEEKLSDAINNIDSPNVAKLLALPDTKVDKSILQKLLDKANDKMKSLQDSKGKKDRQKNNLTEIITLFEKELEKTVTALPVSGDIGATASSQEVPIVERKESELDSPSLSSEDDDFSKLESDDSARISSDSPSFEVINDEAETPIATASEMAELTLSVVTEGDEVELDNRNDDNLGSAEDNYYNCSSSVNNGQLIRAHSESSIFEDLLRASSSPQFAENVGQADLNDSIADKDTQATEADFALAATGVGAVGLGVASVYKATRGTTHDDTAPSPLGATEEHIPEGQGSFENVDNHYDASSLGATGGCEEPQPEGQSNFDGSRNSDQRQDVPLADDTNVSSALSIDGDEEEQQSAERETANENTQPKPMINGQNGNESDNLQNIKRSKWPTVATWMFAITGMLAIAAAPAAYFALGTSLLVAGAVAGIGAFCIVAAIATHYCNKAPSGPLKGPDAEAIAHNVTVEAN